LGLPHPSAALLNPPLRLLLLLLLLLLQHRGILDGVIGLNPSPQTLMHPRRHGEVTLD